MMESGFDAYLFMLKNRKALVKHSLLPLTF